MHHKRPKTKRRVRCTMHGASHRWQGNNRGRFKASEESLAKIAKKEIKSESESA